MDGVVEDELHAGVRSGLILVADDAQHRDLDSREAAGVERSLSPAPRPRGHDRLDPRVQQLGVLIAAGDERRQGVPRGRARGEGRGEAGAGGDERPVAAME